MCVRVIFDIKNYICIFILKSNIQDWLIILLFSFLNKFWQRLFYWNEQHPKYILKACYDIWSINVLSNKFFLNDYENIYYILQRTEPLGVLVLERCTIELDDEIDNAFIIGKYFNKIYSIFMHMPKS